MEKLFISAVTREFGSTRRLNEPIVRRLGYEPVSMDNWSTAEGELIAWLRKQIDESVGIIHLPGNAYGAEPRSFDRESHGFHSSTQIPERYSYTQFELLYERQVARSLESQ